MLIFLEELYELVPMLSDEARMKCSPPQERKSVSYATSIQRRAVAFIRFVVEIFERFDQPSVDRL